MTRHPFSTKPDLHQHARLVRGPSPLEALVARELSRPLGQPVSPESRSHLSDPVYRSEMADRAFDRAQAEQLLDADARAYHAANDRLPIYLGR